MAAIGGLLFDIMDGVAIPPAKAVPVSQDRFGYAGYVEQVKAPKADPVIKQTSVTVTIHPVVSGLIAAYGDIVSELVDVIDDDGLSFSDIIVRNVTDINYTPVYDTIVGGVYISVGWDVIATWLIEQK